ncbi:hypothetical protein Bca4012_060981 [Brassica carinata]
MYHPWKERSRTDDDRHKRKQSRDEEEIIKFPEFDFTDLMEKYKLSLVGRMFHQDGRSVDALIKHMPRHRIWDVEGRVRGTNLENNKFNLTSTEKKICRRCSFDGLATLINGVSLEREMDSNYQGGLPKLHATVGYAQREVNRIARLKQKEHEEVAAREAFSAPLRAYETKGRVGFLEKDHREKSTGRNGQEMLGRRVERYRKEYTQRDEKEDSSDLRTRIASKRNRMAKHVWNRLDQNSGKSLRDNDIFHPYHRDPRDVSRNIRRGSESYNTRTQYGKSDSSSSCRVRGQEVQTRHEPRQEWQPARPTEKRNGGETRPGNELHLERSSESETEEERIRRLKGKAIIVNPTEPAQVSDPTDYEASALNNLKTVHENLPENQAHPEKNKNPVIPSKDFSLQHKATENTVHSPIREQTSHGREVFNQYASVDLEMDEDILDNDDLLDEEGDEEAAVPETRELVANKNREKTKEVTRAGDGDAKKTMRNPRPTDRQAGERTSKPLNAKPHPPSLNKRRGTRSPDTKGLAASKKLASRGRSSLRGKMVRHGRPVSTRVLKLCRFKDTLKLRFCHRVLLNCFNKT